MWEDDSSSSGSGGSKAFSDPSKFQDAVFHELMQECKHSAPGARLSARLRTVLERMSPSARRALCSRRREGCAPLFVAARRGNAEIVEYLVHVCAADLEQRGVYELRDERAAHSVTPLWCAAVCGRVAAVRALADAGARLDAPSDSGSTPLRSACFMSHEAVVRELVARGADPNRANHNGGTCLINGVQSARLCAYLLRHGARVDARDTQHKTALHYAVQEHRLDATRLLLDAGADPHLESRAGDDALRTAALKGAAPIVALLAARVRYEPARLADGYELLGATQLDEFNDVAAALESWRRATAIRRAADAYVPKRPVRAPHRALGSAREWRTLDELEAAAGDVDALRTQALLVVTRVLGGAHKDTAFRLMYRGAAYADAFRYRRCVELWTWALELRYARDTLVGADACHTLCALTRLLLDAAAGRLERARGVPEHEHVARVFALVSAALPEARRALDVRPAHKAHADALDRALRCATHLVYLVVRTAPPAPHPARTASLGAIRALVAADVRSAHTGDTLLHLCVSRLNVIRSTYFSDEMDVTPVFPCVEVVETLVEAGADVRVRNAARSTALHVAAIPYNFSTELVAALLAHGAHLDQPNKFGDSPADLVALNRASRLRPLAHLTLACLAARALLALSPPPDLRALALPRTLRDFVELHRP